MALAIDASTPSDSTTLHGATTSVALSLSTSGTNRIVLVFVATETSATARTVSSVTSSGLTFAKRSSLVYTSNTSFQGDMEVWWAYAAAQLTSQSITINISGACDSGVVAACAISGVLNFVNPWDTSVSLPATNTNGTSTGITASVSGVSTHFANSMIIGFWSSGFNPSQTHAANTGYSQLVDLGTNSSGVTHDSQGYVEQQIVSTTQSGVTVALNSSSTQKWWGMIADAITSDVVGTAKSVTSMSMGMG